MAKKETEEKKSKNKISRESAEAQVEKFYEFYDHDPEYLAASELDNYEVMKTAITKNVAHGILEFAVTAEDCIITLNTPSETFKFETIDGEAKVAQSGADCPEDRHYYMFGKMCGKGPDALRALKGKYMFAIENLGIFFLQA